MRIRMVLLRINFPTIYFNYLESSENTNDILMYIYIYIYIYIHIDIYISTDF